MSDVNRMLLDLLRDYLDNEPPKVDENMPQHLQNETARLHDDWQGHVSGLFMLLGVRLVRDALDDLDELRKGDQVHTDPKEQWTE